MSKQPPKRCPVCDEGNFDVSGEQYDDGYHFFHMVCRLCDASWDEVYEFSHIRIREQA